MSHFPGFFPGFVLASGRNMPEWDFAGFIFTQYQ